MNPIRLAGLAVLAVAISCSDATGPGHQAHRPRSGAPTVARTESPHVRVHDPAQLLLRERPSALCSRAEARPTEPVHVQNRTKRQRYFHARHLAASGDGEDRGGDEDAADEASAIVPPRRSRMSDPRGRCSGGHGQGVLTDRDRVQPGRFQPARSELIVCPVGRAPGPITRVRLHAASVSGGHREAGPRWS